MKHHVLRSKVGHSAYFTTIGGKEYKVEFNKDNDFTVSVPEELAFKDKLTGERVIARKEYGLFLVASNPQAIELVEETEDTARDRLEQMDSPKPKIGRKKKNEEVAV